MKKNKLLFYALIISVFFLFTGNIYAQSTPSSLVNSYFDLTKPVVLKELPIASTKTQQNINLPPFTNITIQEGTFSVPVHLGIYQGNWDSIKKLIPQNQSPITSYYLIFVDFSNKPIKPSKNILIHSSNNYPKTTTYFYPLSENGTIDTNNEIQKPGPVYLQTELPSDDSAFVIAVNKVLNKNDPTLHPGTFSGPKSGQTPNLYKNPFAWLSINMLLGGFLLLLVIIGVILYFALRNNKNKPRGKIDEPQNIIVGGK
jgi:hypothetical protein